MSSLKMSNKVSFFCSQISNRRFDDQTLRILESDMVFKDIESLTEARKSLGDFLRSESMKVIREITAKTIEEKLSILQFFVRAFALLGDIESCLAWRYEALSLRDLKSTTHKWLQVSYVEWLNFAEDSLRNGFHSISRKACENSLSSLERDSTADPKMDDFSQIEHVNEKYNRLKDYAVMLAGSSVEAQTAKYLRRKAIEKSRFPSSPCKETQQLASNMFRYGINKRNDRKFHELKNTSRSSNESQIISSGGQ